MPRVCETGVCWDSLKQKANLQRHVLLPQYHPSRLGNPSSSAASAVDVVVVLFCFVFVGVPGETKRRQEINPMRISPSKSWLVLKTSLEGTGKIWVED